MKRFVIVKGTSKDLADILAGEKPFVYEVKDDEGVVVNKEMVIVSGTAEAASLVYLGNDVFAVAVPDAEIEEPSEGGSSDSAEVAE